MASSDKGASGDKGSKRGDAAKVGASASKASAKAGKGADRLGSAKAGGSKRGRGKPAPVKKPFPVGFAAGVAVLVLALGGILAYAATNVGGGFQDALEKADAKLSGLRVDQNLTQNHTDPYNGARVDYPQRDTRPPTGGNHNPDWYQCAVYTAPIVSEHAVHSLEHGAVWVTYRTDLPADQVKVLTDMVTGNAYALLSPYTGQTAPVMATAWGRQLSAQSVQDPQIKEFLDVYSDGPQNREVGSGCNGLITQPGTAPYVRGGENGTTPVPGPTDGPLVPAQGDLPTESARPTEGGDQVTPDPAGSVTPGATNTPTPATTPGAVVTPAP